MGCLVWIGWDGSGWLSLGLVTLGYSVGIVMPQWCEWPWQWPLLLSVSLKGLQFFADRVNLSAFSPLLCPHSPSALCELHRKRPSEKLVHTEGGGSPWGEQKSCLLASCGWVRLEMIPCRFGYFVVTDRSTLSDPSLSRPALAPTPLTISSKGDSGKEAGGGALSPDLGHLPVSFCRR